MSANDPSAIERDAKSEAQGANVDKSPAKIAGMFDAIAGRYDL